jgi:hypothetical protein
MRAIARSSYRDSRFNSAGFPVEKCDRLYENRFEKICAGRSSVVLVAEWQELGGSPKLAQRPFGWCRFRPISPWHIKLRVRHQPPGSAA